MKKLPIFLDIRSSSEFEETCVNNSLFMHNNESKIPEIVLDYIEKKG